MVRCGCRARRVPSNFQRAHPQPAPHHAWGPEHGLQPAFHMRLEGLLGRGGGLRAGRVFAGLLTPSHNEPLDGLNKVWHVSLVLMS